jgi:tryptophan-rich sensory protein
MNIISFLTSIIIATSAGMIGSIFTAQSVDTWYVTLAKPMFNPPSWVFAPVWTLLYIMMGVAAYLIWRNRTVTGAREALGLYGVQLVFNAGWSMVFFGLRDPSVAFVVIIMLLVLIMATSMRFWRINTWAGALLLPYILWVSFASYLNYMIWQLN